MCSITLKIVLGLEQVNIRVLKITLIICISALDEDGIENGIISSNEHALISAFLGEKSVIKTFYNF